MPDMSMEEIMKGLEHHRHLEASRNELGHDECFDCPYRPDGEDTCASLDRMIEDALKLLKENKERIDLLEVALDFASAMAIGQMEELQ